MKNNLITVLVVEAQKAQNNLLRSLCNKSKSERTSIKRMLDELKMLSVNQMAAQIKLTEMWKVKHTKNYPLKFPSQETQPNAKETRGNKKGKLIEFRMGIR